MGEPRRDALQAGDYDLYVARLLRDVREGGFRLLVTIDTRRDLPPDDQHAAERLKRDLEKWSSSIFGRLAVWATNLLRDEPPGSYRLQELERLVGSGMTGYIDCHADARWPADLRGETAD